MIARELETRGALLPGARGLGFGVGTEPLVSLFASLGSVVTATDLSGADDRTAKWRPSNQHARSFANLNDYGLLSEDELRERVTSQSVDMMDISPDLRDFDFTWSSCALEHLGSLEAGLQFVEESARCLRPGGIAVHTTEFNMTSNSNTLEADDLVLYRRRDIEQLGERLKTLGATLEPVSFDYGTSPLDPHVDVDPFLDEPHLRVQVGGYVATSLGFIVSRH